ncbi:MAG: hypothetical protein IIC24_08480 [Chloroflexi bacterium]|nr:hypothetical protein [Chloroflexota bacterium]
MTAPAPISVKLKALIPRLSSDKPGEVAATAAAITRQLSKAGADWHDLADRLTMAPDSVADDDAPAVFTDYATAVEWLLASDCGDLTARETDFLESMRRILRRWPPKPKQAVWLRDLIERLGGCFNG